MIFIKNHKQKKTVITEFTQQYLLKLMSLRIIIIKITIIIITIIIIIITIIVIIITILIHFM